MKFYDNYKKYKKKLIKKYGKREQQRQTEKKNIDSFISIDNFLDVEMSKGPNADPGAIEYFYNLYENIHNFIHILSKYNGLNKILCSPKFVAKHGKNYIVQTSCVFDASKLELLVPLDFVKEMKKCMDNTS